jgi:rhomboid protease GluP
MILLLNFSMFVATTLYTMNSGASEGETLHRFGAKAYPEIVLGGQWWRLVTAGFLHGGILHIFMNSFALFDLGAQVEEIYGAKRLIVFYFIATVFGFLCSTYWSPYLSVGASAGLFGLIGAMIALGVRNKNSMGDAVRGLYIRWAIYGLVLGLLPGLNVDNAAHIGGLAAGFVMAYLAGTPGFGSWSERFWSIGAYACIFLAAVSFLKMFLWFSSSS